MEFANRTWSYDFSEIPKTFSESSCEKIVAKLMKRYSILSKAWSPDKNTEWLCRSYFAAKLILQSTLTINSMEYAQEKNLRVVVPYLRYYSILSLLRALILTLPEQQWNEGKLLEIGHERAINIASDYISHIKKETAEHLRDQAKIMKSSRELVSYRAPSSGDEALPDVKGFFSLCSLLAELSQFNSELIEASINKNADPGSFELKQDQLYQLSNIEIGSHVFGDTEDAYRLDYFQRKQPRLMNLRCMMREGHVDDYFGAWCSQHEDPSKFNPDEMKNVIFDIP